MPIRPADRSDLPEIVALVRELAEYEHMSDQVVTDDRQLELALFDPEPAARVLVAESDDGAVAGMALWFPTFSTFLGRPGIWLEDLYVRPAHRRHGLGRALLTELRSLTEGRVEWDVLEWNTSAQELYDEMGAVAMSGWIRYRWQPVDAGADA